MKIKHITQGHMECGPASLAMAANLSLSCVKRTLKRLGWVQGQGVTRRAASRLGFDLRYSDGSYMKEHFKSLKRPAILYVPSKNRKNGLHIILVYKGKIYDPQEGNEGLKNYTKDSYRSVIKKAFCIIELKRPL